LFVEQIDPLAWSKVVNVWTPQGTRWLKTIADHSFLPAESWRTYLESSVRFAIFRHYVVSTRRVAVSDKLACGILSPVIALGATQWVPPLLKDSHGVAPIHEIGLNRVSFLSKSFCADMAFVYLQPLVEIQLMNDMGYDNKSKVDGFLENVLDSMASLKNLIDQDGQSWTQSTRTLFSRKLIRLHISFSGIHGFDFEESSREMEHLYKNISSTAGAFVANVLVVRRQRIARTWQMEPEGDPVSVPVLNTDAKYLRTSNTLVISSSMFFWPHYQPQSAAAGYKPLMEMFGNFFGVISRSLAHIIDESGRTTKEDGSLLPYGYWDESTRALDQASFAANRNCLREMIAPGDSTDSSLLDDMVTENIALRVSHNALFMDNVLKGVLLTRPEMTRAFFVAWAQTQCMRIGDLPLSYSDASSAEKLHRYHITLPLENIEGWASAYGCDVDGEAAKGMCDFFT